MLQDLSVADPFLLAKELLQYCLGIAFTCLLGDQCHLPRQIRINMCQDIVAGTCFQTLLFKIICQFGLRQDPGLDGKSAQN